MLITNNTIKDQFKAAAQALLEGNYDSNAFTIWRNITQRFNHTPEGQAELLDLALTDGVRQKSHLEQNHDHDENQIEQEQFFEGLKAWCISQNIEVAITNFDGFIEKAEGMRERNEVIGPVYAAAMSSRAAMYLRGQGEPDDRTNYAAAIWLYDRAVALDNSNAMISRANMHLRGQGEPDDRTNFAAAIWLYDRAVALGNFTARVTRADMHNCWSTRANQADVYRLINLMWCDLLENKPSTSETQKLLGDYSQLIATKLMTIIDLERLEKVVSDGHIIRTLLSSDNRSLLSIFTQKPSALQQVQDHIKSLAVKKKEESRALEAASDEEEEGDNFCDDDDVERSLLRRRRY